MIVTYFTRRGKVFKHVTTTDRRITTQMAVIDTRNPLVRGCLAELGFYTRRTIIIVYIIAAVTALGLAHWHYTDIIDNTRGAQIESVK